MQSSSSNSAPSSMLGRHHSSSSMISPQAKEKTDSPSLSSSSRTPRASSSRSSKDAAALAAQYHSKPSPAQVQALPLPLPLPTTSSSMIMIMNKREEDMDELDLLICHEEFESLVALVERVRAVQQRVFFLRQGGGKSSSHQNTQARDYYEEHRPSIPKSCLAPDEVLTVVERLREQLSFGGNASTTTVCIRRGSYPVTDATMDDNFSILQQELEFCESCLEQTSGKDDDEEQEQEMGAAAAAGGDRTPTMHSSSYPSPAPRSSWMTPSSCPPTVPSPSPSTTTTTTTTKYSKWQSDILLHWLVEHHTNPTLSKPQARELALRTGLTTTQVSTWLQNMRRRRKKNTIQGTKKATHFLDFLFLANERDRNGGVLPPHIEIEGLQQPQTSTTSTSGSNMEISTPKKRKSSSTAMRPMVAEEYPSMDYIPYTPPTPVTSHRSLKRDHARMMPIFPREEDSRMTAAAAAAPTIQMNSSSWDGDDLSFAAALDAVQEDADSLFDGLQTVTESFEERRDDDDKNDEDQSSLLSSCSLSLASLEPVTSMDIEVDENILTIFASTWHDTPGHVATPPSPPRIARHHHHRPVQQEVVQEQDQVQQSQAGRGFSPPLTRSAAAKKVDTNVVQVVESRNDDNDDDSQDLKWMDWDCNHDGGGGGDYYDDLDVSPVSIFRKKIAAAMVEGGCDDSSSLATVDTVVLLVAGGASANNDTTATTTIMRDQAPRHHE